VTHQGGANLQAVRRGSAGLAFGQQEPDLLCHSVQCFSPFQFELPGTPRARRAHMMIIGRTGWEFSRILGEFFEILKAVGRYGFHEV
jgi:hypothetical protein